ncbi:hypothetical protein EVAR_86589_1 [Eumeta japonica]|uniref:Uncharacterized protein n=1 Tax=Eumeta variegata TaxID=151549 RepID=A0A4C1W3M7_EUMVA|nr:hypothetical protein EVAR_86589_1 [Eumeta japonica]
MAIASEINEKSKREKSEVDSNNWFSLLKGKRACTLPSGQHYPWTLTTLEESPVRCQHLVIGIEYLMEKEVS